MKTLINKAAWYFRQLLPLTYVSAFGEDGKRKVAVWKMWFGKCYQCREWTVE